MPLPVTAGAAPWWTSAQFDGLLVTFVMALLGLVAYFVPSVSKITGAQVLDFIKSATAVAVAAGPLIAIVQRVRSKIQPLVWSWASALSHPKTIALKEVQAEAQAANIDTVSQRLAKIDPPKVSTTSLSTSETSP